MLIMQLSCPQQFIKVGECSVARLHSSEHLLVVTVACWCVIMMSACACFKYTSYVQKIIYYIIT